MNDRRYSIFNTTFLEYSGLLNFLNPQARKLYGINIYKFAAKTELVIMIVSFIMMTITIPYSLHNMSALVSYLLVLVVFFEMGLNQFYLIKNSDLIWNLTGITKIDFLPFNTPGKETFRVERFRYNMALTILIILYISICLSFFLSPFFQQGDYLIIDIKNNTYYYRITPINFIIPWISDEFYNKYYKTIYAYDMMSTMCVCYLEMIFDFTVISMCIGIECQMKRIAHFYSAFVFENKQIKNIFVYLMGNLEKITLRKSMNMEYTLQYIHDKEPNYTSNFISAVNGNQRVIKIMREFIEKFQPLILIQVAIYSIILLFACFVITMNYLNGMPLTYPENLKMFSILMMRILHLFICCHFLTYMNDRKESINFYLYCSDWTQANIDLKKLILLIMRMNDSDKTTLKFSMKRIVNMEMFASVMHTAYSMTSVLAKSYGSRGSGA